MNSFIYHTLIMLEDMGMSVEYPEIRHVTLADDGTNRVHISLVDMIGNRVSIEQNQVMKFMMMFTVLDFYIDSEYPELEGLSFSQKYRSIHSDNDTGLMLRELFRIAKVIRNSLVHSPSSFEITGNHLSVNYEFRDTRFGVEISLKALSNFYTSLVMYTKGDLGHGNYFLGVMRSVYNNILAGVSYFSDEFGDQLNATPHGLKIKPYVREVVMNPAYDINDGKVQINFTERNIPEWQGVDFYIDHRGNEVLVPIEALRADLTIDETDILNNWKYESSFPPLKKDSNI